MKTPLGMGLLIGASSIALVFMLTALFMPAVDVYAEISRPSVTAVAAAPAPVVASPTPVPLNVRYASKKRIGLIRGIASWYGGVFNGRKTANGETFDEKAMTACQPSLPFGSIVRVINRRNKRSVVVRINDRGDLIDDSRVIDLSKGAADKLAMTEAGLAKVDIEILSLGRAEAR